MRLKIENLYSRTKEAENRESLLQNKREYIKKRQFFLEV